MDLVSPRQTLSSASYVHTAWKYTACVCRGGKGLAMRDSMGFGTVYMYPEICSVHDMDNCKRSGGSRVVSEVPRHLHF